MKKKGFDDPLLLKLAIITNARYEVKSFDTLQSEAAPYEHDFAWFVVHFSWTMWRSLHALEPDEADALSKDESRLAIWVEVFKFYCISQR